MPFKRKQPSRGGRQARRWGLFAEYVAMWLLVCKGYFILHRRLKTPFAEIDLVARRGQVTVFVEVKYRSGADDAIYGVHLTQKKRLERAAQFYRRVHPQVGACRFDVVLVKPWKFPVHIKNAWQLKI